MKFFLDQDVPDDVERLLGHWGHDVLRLRDALPVTTTDEAVFDFAQRQSRVLISCNRGHFLELARDALSKQSPFEGLIVLIRRRTRQAECSHLLSFLRRAGESGVRGNVNLA